MPWLLEHTEAYNDLMFPDLWPVLQRQTPEEWKEHYGIATFARVQAIRLFIAKGSGTRYF
jgi:hypothetical protein